MFVLNVIITEVSLEDQASFYYKSGIIEIPHNSLVCQGLLGECELEPIIFSFQLLLQQQ